MCAAFAREQGRRTTGRQGTDVRARRRALTPEAWRDLSASDDENSVPMPRWRRQCCADSHCPLVCLLSVPASRQQTHTPLHPGTSARSLATLRGSTACVTARPELTARVLEHANVSGAQVTP